MNGDVLKDLESAIKEHVEPGDTIQARTGYQFSYAAVHELIRQYWDRELASDERLTLAGINTGIWAGPLVEAGAVDHLISAFIGLGYPSPRRHPVIQERIVDGDVTLEDWTYLTLIQRLRAGAMGVPFTPTNSLSGSSIGPDSDTATIDDPLGDGEAHVVSSFEPDVSIGHGLVADRAGNTIVSPIRAEGSWGAFASDRAIITVEKIVDASVIREYSDSVTIPSYAVDAVVEAPFGAHPRPSYNPHHIGSVSDYGYDRDFLLSFREASRSAEALEAWVREWILDTDWEGYLQSLGEDRLRGLTNGTWPQGDLAGTLANARVSDPIETARPTEKEQMIVHTARVLDERIETGDFEVVFGGIGVAHLASWIYRTLCERDDRPSVPLLIESGAYDFEPPRGEAYIFSPRALPSAKSIDGSVFALGTVIEDARSLALLTGAQIDRAGNVNSSRLGGEPFVGSGGANDALSNADEVVLVVEASPNRLVEEVEFITGPGRNVTTVCTQYGILRKRNDELRIETVFVPRGESADERLETFKQNVGWDVQAIPDVETVGWSPDDDELIETLRAIDPAGDFRA
jgi:acyl CoA:acetate/3-ketoacid CoA transferase alpha subunit